MTRFKVVGSRKVAGISPGQVAVLDLSEAQERRLIAAGHIEPVVMPESDDKENDDG
jgi:hypothetical protein